PRPFKRVATLVLWTVSSIALVIAGAFLLRPAASMPRPRGHLATRIQMKALELAVRTYWIQYTIDGQRFSQSLETKNERAAKTKAAEIMEGEYRKGVCWPTRVRASGLNIAYEAKDQANSLASGMEFLQLMYAENWLTSANPLISFAPPYNASDPLGRKAVARLGPLPESQVAFPLRDGSEVRILGRKEMSAGDPTQTWLCIADAQIGPNVSLPSPHSQLG
ncbi:MAG: hypothetical protein HGA75_19285, partial [Thiobacillus sp.]|nr:hypothetical protein [Thiobacillus sp.]